MTRPQEAVTWELIAREQDGTLARWQALRLGMTEASWNWFRTTGRWRTIVPGVAATHSGEPTDRQRAWAAVLHAGPGAALSGDAGLVEYGVDLGRAGLVALDVAVPWPRNVRGHDLVGGPAVRPHGVRELSRWVHPVREPPVVLIEVAVLHAAAWALTDRAAEWRIAALVQQRRTTPTRLRTTLEQLPRLRRRALMRVVLDDVELGAHAGSELEFLRFCTRQGLPRPDELQVLVRANGKKYVDARYRRQRISVELDGAHHRLVSEWEADALRTLHLAVAHHGTGETQIRLTKGNLRHDQAEVAGLLRQLLL